MIGDILAALFILYVVLPVAGYVAVWLLVKFVYLIFPAPH